SDRDVRVVGIARHGGEAVAMARALRPDIMTMDVRMPVMDGIEATSAIMEEAPCPILVVSAAVHDDTNIAFRAIAAGAMDVVGKPEGAGWDAESLVRHVRLVASVPTIRRPRRRVEGARSRALDCHVIVAIAASTGGPAALAALL